jgi:hypothetical protein
MSNSSSTVDTSPVNPIIQQARWITTKLRIKGQRALTGGEKTFIAQLSYRATVQNDRTAQRLISDITVAHLEYQLTLTSNK